MGYFQVNFRGDGHRKIPLNNWNTQYSEKVEWELVNNQEITNKQLDPCKMNLKTQKILFLN